MVILEKYQNLYVASLRLAMPAQRASPMSNTDDTSTG
jgi:hypothetical protein